MLRHVDLCSGIGGFALGFQWAELSKTIMFCDTEKWCREILAKNFPNVPITNDVKELANDPERLVPDHDILTAGYPCQPFSVAGRQKGEKDDRHIWPYIFRIIACKRPTWCVFENVYGHVALGLDKVLADLESEGYSTRTFIVPACAKDAPHRRDRLWIIAHSDSKSEPDVSEHEGKRQGKLGERTTIMADSESGGRGRNGDLGETQGSSQSDATQFDSFGGISSRPDIVGDTEHDGSLAAEIGRSDEENARGSEERSETTEQPSRASGSGHDETLSRPDDVADTESERAGKNNERIRSGISRISGGKGSVGTEEHDVADSDSESSRGRGFSKQIDGQKRRISETGRKSVQSRDRATCAGNIEQSRQDVADTTFLGLQEHGHSKSGKSVEGSQNVADSDSQRLQGSEQSEAYSREASAQLTTSKLFKETRNSWAVEPDVGRVAHGIPRRVDRLKGLGNAIVPQISMQIGLAIKKEIER